jgi:hypothetical protein
LRGLQIQETRLAYILDLGAGGTDLGLLESSARSGVPTEDGEGTGADLSSKRDQLMFEWSGWSSVPCIPCRILACSARERVSAQLVLTRRYRTAGTDHPDVWVLSQTRLASDHGGLVSKMPAISETVGHIQNREIRRFRSDFL